MAGDVSPEAPEPSFGGYSCPWCPIVVMVVDDRDAARRYMEAHLDDHMAHAVGRPGVAA